LAEQGDFPPCLCAGTKGEHSYPHEGEIAVTRRPRRNETLIASEEDALLAAYRTAYDAGCTAVGRLACRCELACAIDAARVALAEVARRITDDSAFFAAGSSSGPSAEERWQLRRARRYGA
jgi:hypothetical protein